MIVIVKVSSAKSSRVSKPQCRWVSVFIFMANLVNFNRGNYNSRNEPPYKGLPWLFFQVRNSALLTFDDYPSHPSPLPLTSSPGPYGKAKQGENYETNRWAHQLSHVESQTRGENNPPSRALYLEPHSFKLLRGLRPQTY